jgi:Ca-activated chloride channel family protein
MKFLWPAMFLWLLLIPLFIVVYVRMLQRRRRLAESFSRFGFAPGADSRRLAVRRHLPAAFFLVALMVLIFALARPETLVTLPRLEGTVVLAFDVSGSMAADDMKPSRLEAAKTAAKAFVERQPPDVQIGVATFSDGGLATLPPTNDQAAVVAAMNRLTVQKGTSVASGIEASLKLIDVATNPTLTLSTMPRPSPTTVPKGTYTSAVIVLLTDGENNESPDPLASAQTAADRGIRIYTIGVGSTAGATLHIGGFTIQSRLDEQTLQQISQLTGGTYNNAPDEQALQTIYDNLNPQLIFKPQEQEVTSLFAGAGIFVLMIGGMLSLLWLGRLP